MDYKNVVNLPILKNLPPEAEVLFVFVIDELHAMLRLTKKQLDGLDMAWGENHLLDFLENELHLDKKAFQLGQFAGNDCKTVLKNLDKLENCVPENCVKYVTCLRKFEEVRVSCFGHELREDFEEKIAEFVSAYSELVQNDENKMSVILKLHYLEDHVPQFCRTTGKGLGFFSAQTGEMVHNWFWKHFEKQKVKLDRTNLEKMGNAIVQAMADFNSKNIGRSSH